MLKLFIYFTAIFLGSCKANAAPAIVLWNNGATQYNIYISGSSAREKEAALILQEYLQKISGVTFNITTERNKHQVCVLSSGNAKKLFEYKELDSLQQDGVLIRSNGDDLLLSGAEEAGLENAVYEFLEKFMGCRYFAHDAVYVPSKRTITIQGLNYKYVPVIKYRYIHYSEAYKGEYAKWNKLTNVAGNVNDVKFPQWGLWVHSAFTLVPPEKYFSTHPEYYALRNGKRVKTQLCFSNPDVLKIAVENLSGIIAAHPDAKYFSVSQMDNSGFCMCDKCMAIASKEESQSGPIIYFVNLVAKNFPGKTISTLAYNYSRKAPANIKPASNVNIFFCATNANRAVAFISDKTEGSVYTELMVWKQKTNDIFFWDYLIDFDHLLMPFPVYSFLKSNIRLLANNGIDKTFQQGWAFNGAEMNELRCYLVSKLLWDPSTDVNAARKEFLNYYYGPAGKWIDASINVFDNYVATHKIMLGNYDNPYDHATDYLSPEEIQKFRSYILKAAGVVKGMDTKYVNRVELVKQSLRYISLEVNAKTAKGKQDKKFYLAELDTLRKVAKKNNINLLSESSLNVDDYYREDSAYINKPAITNLLLGANIKMTILPANTQETNLRNLVNGLYGNKSPDKSWVSLNGNATELVIDAGIAISFDSLKMNFLHDPTHLILLPESIKFAVSDNGTDFKEMGITQNPYKNLGVKKEIKSFQFVPGKTIKTRYLKVTLKIIDTSSYIINDRKPVMLCDEITAL